MYKHEMPSVRNPPSWIMVNQREEKRFTTAISVCKKEAPEIAMGSLQTSN